MSENVITIGTGRGAVWQVLADGWKYTNWVVGTSHMRAVSPAWPGPGAKLYHSAGAWPIMTRDETEVLQSQPGGRIVLLARGRPLGAAEVRIELEDDGDGCRVTLRETAVEGAGRALHNAVTDPLLRRRNTESLARLAALCERRTQPVD